MVKEKSAYVESERCFPCERCKKVPALQNNDPLPVRMAPAFSTLEGANEHFKSPIVDAERQQNKRRLFTADSRLY
jgi:hypothetical protein